MPLLRQTGPLRAIALALIVWAFAGCAPVARALSRPGLIVQEIEAGRIVLHRAACAHDNRPLQMHCHARVLVRADGRPAIGKAATASGLPQGYGPADLRSAYGVTFVGNSATVIAIIDAYGYPEAESDLATYRAQFGLPPCTAASGCFVRVNQRGGSTPPQTDPGWAQEQALDIEMASAMCPNCRILLIEADDDNETNLATAVLLAVARGAAAISNSYGGAEHDTRQYARTYQHPGIAITASAGDSGYGTEFPASTPFTIAVGGTRLVNDATTLRGWRESVWTGTGSGCSAIYPKPGWQTDPLCTRRMMNDVAAVAAPGTGVAVYGPLGTGGTSGWMVFGGTSVGAPLVAGIYAAAGARPTGGRSLWLHQGALNDVTRGTDQGNRIWKSDRRQPSIRKVEISKTGNFPSNAKIAKSPVCDTKFHMRLPWGTDGACGGTYFCAAQTGYDGPSGNGTPRGKLAL